ncbi:P-loop containing nucleoside triphosphate hydrolase protein [Meira miltonrushii]|uniref:RNA helicase n=1 Tax=Meira miltonrushii TaxID=1280837 RepID=A0A316VDQ8_9BASI|nr:P-loop containing nucleoside triphosphate hydrolase protein [Meira miltonrushii]PWN35454.1 P-loop containing nucleoside triphosphate hydrolase protein [Meira miltonrushii]
MSSKEEKKAEKAVKSAHKKEKKRKAIEALENGEVQGDPTSPSAEKQRRAEKKAAKAEAEADASTDKASEKAAKKARKEAKKAKAVSESAPVEADVTSTPIASTSKSTNAAAARAYMETNNVTIEAPEESNEKPPLPMLSFDELKGRIDDRLKKELDSNKFTKPTPIQACCWSVLLANKDVVGIAETGSGKTMAFGLPAMQHILQLPASENGQQKKGKGKYGKGGQNVSVLVIAPTRELAIQTQVTMEKLAASIDCASICLYGGVSKPDQIRQLQASPKTIRAVVGTPGRVLDLAREGSLDLSNVTYAVLDEADRMLDVGFEPDIRAILGMTRNKDEGRHTSMFSATWPMDLRGLAETFMREPMRVTIGSDELSANHRVEQSVEVLEDSRAKQGRLETFLRNIGAGPRGRSPKDKVIIFALYKKEAQRVEDTLKRKGYNVAGIHGDLSQQQRIASLDAFKSGEAPLLVATDVAARGIDVPLVEYVVNYTFPLTIEDYVHRIGRTGRAGRTGKSITFFTSEDKSHAGELIRILKDSNQPVPKEMLQFPTTIKRKEHGAYGAHFRELVPGKAKKITFDD